MVFRVDASERIGTGHVVRCLTLAAALREQQVESHFVCREHAGNLCDAIAGRGFPVKRLPRGASPPLGASDVPPHAAWLGTTWEADADETRAGIEATSTRPDWLVVDHYALDSRWESAMKGSAGACLAIDDLADRKHECDLLLDQNLTANLQSRYSVSVPAHCRQLLGPDYALLQSAYASLHDSAVPRTGPVRRLFVYFGGVDAHGLTDLTLRACSALKTKVEIDVVVAAGARTRDTGNVRFHSALPSLGPLMMQADLAIGAAGVTTWERLCLGLPTLVITAAENQRPVTAHLHELGLVRLIGHHDEIDEASVTRAIEEACALPSNALRAWSERCLRQCDGRGVSRVVAAMAEASGAR